ncbi:MAG: MFS transporter [Acidimicrobiales bacterium]
MRSFHPLRALPFDLSPPSLVERVVAMQSLTFQIAMITGPVLGGFLYVVWEALPYLVASLLLALGIAVLSIVPDVKVEKLVASVGVRGTISDAREGLRFVRRTPVLFGAISLDLFAVLFGGAVALLPAIATERLGVGAIGFGWLRASVGMGAASVSFALTAKPVSRHVGTVLMAAVAVFGLATVVLGLTTSYAVAFIALFVLSGSDSISVFIRSTVVPMATPPNMRGRVLATENVFIGASNELGAFVSGVAASLLGLVGAVVLGGTATLAVVGLWWVFFPALRSIDRFSEVLPVAPAPDVLDPKA